ncbi:tumor necrosis factor receptor superfamily member 18 [Centropristis striata]|uniref:tumor necrosis factor receptor superfamily member 18 n=1 Tax=Centropristis striata TaxID=184440 RepID=UPI0027E0C4B8|nr:tumor necrosis factor receptor superfamily member 18 [Centropristis striata]
MIPLSLPLAVTCLLTIWNIEYAAGCGDRQMEVDGKCCNMCPPGTYMKELCTKYKQTVCVSCEDQYFSDKYNLFDRCEECRSCQQEYTEKCTHTTNGNCSCRSGFLCSNNACSKCEENKCVNGEKLKRTDSASFELTEYSYQCEPLCPDNAYYIVKGGICKLHRDGGASSHWVLGIGFVLLSLSFFVFLSYVCIKKQWKQKTYNHPKEVLAVSTPTTTTTITPTTTTDFHLSKEESGLELVIQDESKNNNSLGFLRLEESVTPTQSLCSL